LIGLPPTPQEVDAFLADKSKDAYAKQVERLLASPHYGERWAQYWLDAARTSALIDSPGFQEFGLRHIAADRLAALMPDIGRHASECRFYNCTHRHEPGCGVLAALGRGEIAESRYRIYREIFEEL